MTYQQSPVVRVSSFPQSSMVSPCLWLAPRGRGGGSFCVRVRDSLFRGEGGVVVDFERFIGWIFQWGWRGERYGGKPTEVSFCVAVRKTSAGVHSSS